MTLASISLALWLGTVFGLAGLVVGYRIGKAEGKRNA